ncbi:Nitrate transporter 1.4 [Acorus calamus]|uniref:Nitrate transporter 1.4 n=1 Tax=Acorus calamus TaxID=4465 RepID=A0AAV9EDC3_ACOCL|nr:Nitrate transporter 1.4 [Acorus calamus]
MLAMSTALPQLRPPLCNPSAAHCERANGFQMGVLYLSLYVIALGTGGLKSSISGFGTDQFDDKDEREKAQMNYFFTRFFFFISTGTLLVVTVLVYIQEEVGRSWAYGICSISMMIAILLFLSGSKRYRYKKSSGSPIVHILQVVVAATKNRKLELPVDPTYLFEASAGSPRIPHTDQFRSILGQGGNGSRGRPREETEWVAINPWRMITFSVEQATTMERTIRGFQIPAGSLAVFFVGAILITLAFYDRAIMPLLKKWKGKPEGFTNLQKIAIGLALSMMGMAVAAIAEMKRLSVAKAVGTTASSGNSTLPLSVFVLIPQFFFVGAGEALIYTGQLDFFITRSPIGMKTMSTGLFLMTLSLGFFVSSFLVSIVKSVTARKGGPGWLADNINHGRLDYFYGLLAALSLVNFVAYLVCAAWMKPQEHKGTAAEMDGTGVKGSTTSVDEKC